MSPADEIKTHRIAHELMSTPPEQGYLTISNALKRRLRYGRLISQAGVVQGVNRIHQIMASAKLGSQPDEFGDFQTPSILAERVCTLLADTGYQPTSLLEPTCGVGNFLIAALDRFPQVNFGLGLDINEEYLHRLSEKISAKSYDDKVKLLHENFFNVDWSHLLRKLTEPILVVGNPPWVTNSTLGTLGSSNLPKKSNFQNFNGLDAITGKSNFDISEWMIIKLLELLDGRQATVAMLCKTAVARKVLTHAWKNDLSLTDSEIHPIDAAESFGAAVDACLLICELSRTGHNKNCRVHRELGLSDSSSTFGYHDGRLIADVAAYERWKHLSGKEIYKWRSGVKHDCSKVMELRKEGERYRNGHDEIVELEDDYLFPMLKSSEITNGRSKEPSRWMLLTQTAVGDETSVISIIAPKTWQYLLNQAHLLDRRAGSIYRNRPRFSIFGVGDYTFAPWKVAISGFYKQLKFATVGPYEGRCVVLDDTSYFTACECEEEARFIAGLLNSSPAREFYSSFIFWDSKRPITIDTLSKLDLSLLSDELGCTAEFDRFRAMKRKNQSYRQTELF